MNRDMDVAILGGGVAGLAAARDLGRAGLKVALFEARARLGGRIDTRHEIDWPWPIECGAEFVHGLPQETWNILRGANLHVVEMTGNHWWAGDGQLQPRSDRWERIQGVLERLGQAQDRDRSFAEFLKDFCQDLPAEDRELAIAYVEGFNAADQHRISTRWLVQAEQEFEKIHAEQGFRLPGGYDGVVSALVNSMASNTETILSAPVRVVRWQPGRIECEVRVAERPPEIWAARAAIVTLPVVVLQAGPEDEGGLAWTPDLPAEKRDALKRLVMGPVIKLVLRFREAFWEADVPELGFLHGGGGFFPTWWSTLPLAAPTLTGWAGGVAAEQIGHCSDDELLNAGLEAIERLLRPRQPARELLIAGHVCHWQRDPFSRGAYSYPAVGGADAPQTLARPVADTLFFAGEATHPGLSGTVAGALASGYRAAREVLTVLERP
jgi:monoamine oxidase